MTRSGIAATRDALRAQSLVLRAIGGEFPATQEAVLVTRNRFRAIGDEFPAIGGEFPVTQEAVLVASGQGLGNGRRFLCGGE
jgi:hypothetical protein